MGVLVAALAGMLGMAVWAARHVRTAPESALEGLQVFGTLSDFALTERSGRRVTQEELRGKVWITNFIYTHCTDTCPLQSARMARLQVEFAGERDLRLVSITVDPERDTPPVLAEYAGRFGADAHRWLFLTGEKQAIYSLAQEGFSLNVEEPGIPRPGPGRRSGSPTGGAGRSLEGLLARLFEPTPAQAHSDFLAPPFIHSAWFVLGDRRVRIRGYYPSEDDGALQRLRRDLTILLREDGA